VLRIKLINSCFNSCFNSFSNTDEQPFIEIEVHCSKGTYIRTLCEDIGKKMGCGAFISELRRIQSGPFSLSQSITLDELNGLNEENLDSLLLATDTAIGHFTAIELNESEYERINYGHSVVCPDELLDESGSHYRLYHHNILIALAILNEDKQLQPKRLLFLS